MTTNVRDSNKGKFATDSRWSVSLHSVIRNSFVYTDSGRYNKIMVGQKLALMFAGSSSKIAAWKKAVKEEESGRPQINWEEMAFDDIAVSIFDKRSKKILLERKHNVNLDPAIHRLNTTHASFAGTGTLPAYLCWSQHKDPIKAVHSAKTDPFTGGNPIVFDFNDGSDTLLQPESTLDDLHENLKTQGKFMITTSSLSPSFQGIPIADAVEKYPSLKPAIDKIGLEFEAFAPFADTYQKWTPAEKDNLVDIMKSVYRS